jgi:hypothetical protein
LRPTDEERARAVALAAELRCRLRKEGRLGGRFSADSVARFAEIGKTWWRLREETGDIRVATEEGGRIVKIEISVPASSEHHSRSGLRKDESLGDR